MESLLVCSSFCREAFDNKFNVAVENEMDDYARFPRGEPGPSWQPVPTCRPGGLPAVLPEITSPAVCGIPHQCIAHLWSSLWKTQETWDSERLSHFTKVTQLMDCRIKSGFHFRFFFFDQNKILNNAKKFSMHWGSVICPRQQISRKALDSCFRNKIACAMVTFYIYCCILLPFYLIDSKPTIFHHCMLECHNCINRFYFVLSAPLVCRAI